MFDLAGAHRLVVRWCACDGAPPKRIQLFRRRWFPATAEDPSSAFTFDMLGLFHDLKNQNEDESAFHRVVTEYAKDAGLNPEMARFYISLRNSLTHQFSVSICRHHRRPILLGRAQTRPRSCATLIRC